MKNTWKLLLKIGGLVLIVLGAACVAAGYFDQIKAACPFKKKPAEFEDFADVD